MFIIPTDLEDWKMGQFIQYDDTVDVKWKAGDGHLWDSDVLHVSANAARKSPHNLRAWCGFLDFQFRVEAHFIDKHHAHKRSVECATQFRIIGL